MHKKKLHKKRATSYDVACLAGVSQSAVSRCFKTGASTSKKMRDRVMKAAKALNYQPNALARSLITQRSNLVAIIVSSQMNFYYPEVLFQLTDQFSKTGIRVLLFYVDTEADVERCMNQIWQYQVDGVISVSYLSINQYNLLKSRRIPVILFNRFFSNHSANTVWCDPTIATREIIDDLVFKGHRRFALLCGPEDSPVGVERIRIVENALKVHHVDPICHVRGNYLYKSAKNALYEIHKSKTNPTVIIAANDMMAMGVLDELKISMKVSIPKDMSIVGFDGIGAARFASYQLTTIRQPIKRMSETAISMLIERIEKPETLDEKRILTGILIQGTSTGPAPDNPSI